MNKRMIWGVFPLFLETPILLKDWFQRCWQPMMAVVGLNKQNTFEQELYCHWESHCHWDCCTAIYQVVACESSVSKKIVSRPFSSRVNRLDVQSLQILQN